MSRREGLDSEQLVASGIIFLGSLTRSIPENGGVSRTRI